jgi:hypothetical protein
MSSLTEQETGKFMNNLQSISSLVHTLSTNFDCTSIVSDNESLLSKCARY